MYKTYETQPINLNGHNSIPNGNVYTPPSPTTVPQAGQAWGGLYPPQPSVCPCCGTCPVCGRHVPQVQQPARFEYVPNNGFGIAVNDLTTNQSAARDH